MYDDNFINLLKSNQIVVPLDHDYEGHKHIVFAKDSIDQVPLGATIRPVIAKIIYKRVPNLGEFIWEGGNTIRRSYSGQSENVVHDIDPITVPIAIGVDNNNTYSLVRNSIELPNNTGIISGRLYFQCIDEEKSYDMTGYTENTRIVAIVVKFEEEKVSGPKDNGNGEARSKHKKRIKASTLMLLMHTMNQNKKG